MLLTQNWPSPQSLMYASDAVAQQHLEFDRTFVPGALVAEALWVAWRWTRD